MKRTPSTARIKPSGLVVASVGFLLTRFTVVSSLRMDVGVVPFLVGELPFLLVGLGLAVAGVALTVGPRRPAYVRTVALWSLLGVAGVGVVVLLTGIEAGLSPATVAPSLSFVPRILLGGAAGGLLTGIYAARARDQRRALADRSDRLTVLNRLLRHEVLNDLTVIRGYAGLDDPDAADRIRRSVDHVDDVINQVGVFTRGPERVRTLDLTEAVREALATARHRHPEATFEFDDPSEAIWVRATTRLDTALGHLLDNAVEHDDGEAPTVHVTVDADSASGWVSVADEGPGLPAEQRASLRDRTLPEFDDPTTGFGLAIVRLLLDECDAELDASVDEGTTVTATFQRAGDGPGDGVSASRLATAGGASLVGGVVMGAVMSVTTGSIPVIGALYGAGNVLVGWLTHLFHSVVFGLGFAAAVSHPMIRAHVGTVTRCIAAGVVYGLALAVVAAGVVMPLWLGVVGIPRPVPNVTAVGTAGHVLWGAVLGGLFALGRRAVARS